MSHKLRRRIDMRPNNGDFRADGRRFDGTTWRRTGINHHADARGMVFYKRKHRTIDGYLQQGGSLDKIVFNVKKVQDYIKLVKNLYDNVSAGDVYVMVNPAWDGWVKIGKAVDAKDRCNAYQTSSPFRDYKLIHSDHFENRDRAEKEAHKIASKIAAERKGEWFKMSIEQAKESLKKVVSL